MFGVRNFLTVSKLKHVSNVLDCSFSSLRFSLRSDLQQNNFASLAMYRTFSSDPNHEQINMESITKGDKELLKKMKVLLLEVDILRQEGHKVPSYLSENRWEELLMKTSRSQRIKQLAFWWLNEMKREQQKKKKEEKKSQLPNKYLELEEKKNTDHIFYGMGGTSMFLRIYDQTIDHHSNKRLIQAMMFGQDLVVDCGYDKNMNNVEVSLCSKQLCIMFAENRMRKEPFNLYFCNANKESRLIKHLLKRIPTLYDETFPLNITEKSYMDLFPKDKLVYLTPHCRNNLKTFSHDDTYIIGALVDKVNNDPLSLAKAKSLGLRMAKLPLDHYLDWGFGGKSLTLNQVQLILSEIKDTGDWNKAFQHVPKRKVRNDEDYDKTKRNNFYYLKKRNLVR